MAFRAASSGEFTAASGPVTIPTGTLGGDLLVLFVARSANEAAPTPPTGYTQVGTTQQASSLSLYMFTKVAGGTVGSATTDTSFTYSSTVSGRNEWILAAYSGVNTTTPMDVTPATTGVLTAGASTNHPTPAVSAVTAGSLIVEVVVNKAATIETAHVPPAGVVTKDASQFSASTSSPYMSIGHNNTGATADSTSNDGGDTWTSTQSSQYITATLVLRSAAAAAAGTGALSLSGSGVATGPGATGTGVLSLSGAGAAVARAAGTGALALAGSGVATSPSVTYLDVGGPAADGFVVVAKGANISTLSLKVSTSSSMTSPSTFAFGSPDSDGFYRVTATGLSPFTAYYYQLSDSVGGAFGPVCGPIYTAPTPGAQTSFNVTLGACVRSSSTNGVALANATARAAHLNIFTGDQSYGSTTSTTVATHEAQVLNQLAAVPSYAAFWRNTAKLLTLSDHDAGPDNGPSNLTDAPYQQASIDAYKHYTAYRALADTRSPTVGRYFSVVYGRVKFIVIDIRNTDRTTVTATGTSSDTMLGATQKAWLKAELLTGEPFKVIIGDTQLTGPDDNTGGVPVKGDWWPAYPHERDEIFATYIPANNCGHVEYWHGDSHLIGYATAAKNSALGGVPSICAAGYDQDGGGRATSSFSSIWNNSSGPVTEYGHITFTDNGTSIVRTFTGYDSSSGTDVARVTDTVTVNLAAGNGSLSLSGSGAAKAPVAGTGALSLAGSVAAAGRATGTGTVALGGSAAIGPAAAGTGSLALAGSGTAKAPVAGTGTLSLGGLAAAAARAAGTGLLALAGSGVGSPTGASSASFVVVGGARKAAAWYVVLAGARHPANLYVIESGTRHPV